MVEQLFGSKTRVKLLQLFYANPNRSFYVREITRKIDEQINSVRRELANLLSIGIIKSDTNNNRLYYEVDQKYEYYQPLSDIFGGKVVATELEKAGKKSVSKAPKESKQAQEIKSLGNVELALLTGQFTRDESSGIDVLIVGDINSTKLDKYIEDLETKESKEINYTVMPKNEFDYRRQVKDKFLTNVLDSKSQVIIDKHGILQTQTEEA